MAALQPRTIDWIEQAPLRIEANATSTASPSAVFAVLADHERWPEWFPSLKSVTVLGPAEGVGARRRVAIPGATVDEEFIVWEPGERWSFTGIAARPRFTRSLVEDCRLTAVDGGGTAISYTMYLDPPALLRPLMTLMARQMRANNAKAMANLATRAASTPAI
ncbi:MAG: SRPBCC family protein [Actinomycetota bacterium]